MSQTADKRHDDAGPAGVDQGERGVLNGGGFPQVARLELDQLLEELIVRAREVQATQGRLRGLLRANLEVAGAVDLDEVLRHILHAARTLVSASYAALGVVEQGRLVRFLHVGMEPGAVRAIGHLPEGKGLLGRLIDYPQPLRLPDIAEHLSSVGFPEHHPPMRSFLGVPIRVGERVFGNLYLTDKQGAAGFGRDDEELVLALAAAAGVAIANAALFAESRRRQDWQAAMVALSNAVLTSDDPDRAGDEIARLAKIAAPAAGACVLLPAEQPGLLRAAAAHGTLAGWAGRTVPVDGSLYQDLPGPVPVADPGTDPRTAEPPGVPAGPLGPLVAAPMRTDVAASGVLVTCRRPGDSVFGEVDLEMIGAYAGHAALVLQLTEARRDNERLRLVEDREEIAVDLQHRVVQRLFRHGLDLHGVAARMPAGPARTAIEAQIDEVDAVIREVRDAVYSLRAPADPAGEAGGPGTPGGQG